MNSAGSDCVVDLTKFEADVMKHARSVAADGERLCGLQAGWDHDAALRVSFDAVRNAVELVARVACAECLTPSVSPTTSGRVLLDWTWGDDHVEIEVGPDPAIEVLIEVDGEKIEATLRLDDSRHLHQVSWYVTGVGADRFVA